MAMTAMLQARRELVQALKFGDMAMCALIGDEEDARVLAEHGVDSFVALWEQVAASVERVWQTPDPVVGEMYVLTYDEADVAAKRRLVAPVLEGLLVAETDIFGAGEDSDDG